MPLTTLSGNRPGACPPRCAGEKNISVNIFHGLTSTTDCFGILWTDRKSWREKIAKMISPVFVSFGRILFESGSWWGDSTHARFLDEGAEKLSSSHCTDELMQLLNDHQSGCYTGLGSPTEKELRFKTFLKRYVLLNLAENSIVCAELCSSADTIEFLSNINRFWQQFHG